MTESNENFFIKYFESTNIKYAHFCTSGQSGAVNTNKFKIGPLIARVKIWYRIKINFKDLSKVQYRSQMVDSCF